MAGHQLEAWANPSSLHGEGLKAADLLERSRLELAAMLGFVKGEVIFTSGGTEANNLALFGVCRSMAPARLLHSPLEHPAVVEAAIQLRSEGWQLELVPIDSVGMVNLAALEPLLEPPTRLLSLVWGSSEIGTLQPMAAVAAMCKAKGVLLHSDAVQVIGQIAVDHSDTPVDLLSLSGHKFQGPRGIGALLVGEGIELKPQLLGGGQEGGHRSGTEPVVLAAGLVKALGIRNNLQPSINKQLALMRNKLLVELIDLPGVELSGPINLEHRLPHHLSFLLSTAKGEPLSGRAMVRALARKGVACSSGSACSSGREGSSRTLLALGLNDAEAASGVRISVGPWLEPTDLDPVKSIFKACLAELSELKK
jgi:cysteine desulfurase